MSAIDYIQEIKKIIEQIEEKQLTQLKKAADQFADTVKKGGVIHVFGAGHSHMLAEEVFYRAGGMAVFNPLLDQGIMLEGGAVKSTRMERLEGYGQVLLTNYQLQSDDTMVVVSNSGRNPVPIEVALQARQQGLKIIVITSLSYSQATTSRHSSGKLLYQIADIVLDNHTPYGDAVLSFGEIKAVPASTISGVLIINSIIAETLYLLDQQGFNLPVYISGNIDGADQKNLQLVEKYGSRIRHI